MRDHVVLEDVPEWDVTVAQFHHPALRKVVSLWITSFVVYVAYSCRALKVSWTPCAGG